MKRRREKITYNYECSLTNEPYVTTEKAPNPKDLVSIKAYYDMHPEMDDRPAIIKKRLGIGAAATPVAPEEKH
ncbi:MAG TPA: hypothetical protein VNJ01_05270 [Bacteriovoracaceae bacterium]|nr:hypothetical protein [Bacteriovoracaceae bacterium]